MRIVKIYPLNEVGKQLREKEEKKLLLTGYRVFQEEPIRKWSPGKACCFGCLFLPLIFFAWEKCVKVTYDNS